jgi:hypothetical protein
MKSSSAPTGQIAGERCLPRAARFAALTRGYASCATTWRN